MSLSLVLLLASLPLGGCSDPKAPALVGIAGQGGAGGAQAGAGGQGAAGAAGTLPLAGTGASGSAAPASDAGLDGEVDAATDAAVSIPLAVSFEPPSCTFTSAQSVTLTPLSSSAKLYYTLDGSMPSSASTPYTAAISVNATTLLRVAAYEAGTLMAVQSASYVQLAADVQSFDSNLPLMVIHMLGGAAPTWYGDTRLPAIAQFHDRAADGRAALLGNASLDTRISIKARGKSTRLLQDKLGYSFEIHDQLDADDESAQVLDLPAQSDWVLYAPYNFDRAMIRNAFWYALSRSIGRYAPRTRFVEVYLADNNQVVSKAKYVGVYVLTEKIKRDKDRLAISKLAPDDNAEPAITGGYIVRVDAQDLGDVAYTIAGIPEKVIQVYPDADEMSAQQSSYWQDYLNATGRAFAAANHIDATTGKSVSDLVDVDAFIDHHILSLFAKNPDALRLSSYMFKDRGKKLEAGPLWDCDRCMGSYDGRDASPMGWNPMGGDGTNFFTYGWWPGLFSDAAVEAKYWDRFESLLGGALSEASVLAIIDPMADELDEAAVRNAERWPNVPYEGGKFRNEIDKLKTWLKSRITWGKANIGVR